MTKFSAANERIKHRYLTFLADAKRRSVESVDQAAAALVDFETSTGCKDFRLFRIEHAQRYKRELSKATNVQTGKPLAKATISSRLAALKAFFQWLALQPGYRRLTYSDAEYFNLSANDERIAKTVRERPVPSMEQIRHVIFSMPGQTDIEKRNRALIAFTLLSGARDNAIASLSLKHVDLSRRKINQNAREVRTKNAKTINTTFFPVGEDVEEVVVKWINFLEAERLWGPDDPLFPATNRIIGPSGYFESGGLARQHWKDAGAIRRIFREAFERAGLPYFNPHSFRNTLARLGQKVCPDIEAFKAWSQNFGHEHMLTTLTSYGTVAQGRQAELMNELRSNWAKADSDPDEAIVRQVIALLKKAS